MKGRQPFPQAEQITAHRRKRLSTYSLWFKILQRSSQTTKIKTLQYIQDKILHSVIYASFHLAHFNCFPLKYAFKLKTLNVHTRLDDEICKHVFLVYELKKLNRKFIVIMTSQTFYARMVQEKIISIKMLYLIIDTYVLKAEKDTLSLMCYSINSLV